MNFGTGASALAFSFSLLFTTAALAQSQVVRIEAGPDFPYRLQTAIILARPGTTIEMGAGKFEFHDELMIRTSHLTLRGQGMGKTILSFAKQENGGQGVLVTGNAFTAEDFAIEDSPGDGLKMAGIDGITVRRVRVEWTRGPHADNGSYALYPVQSKNILIEDSVAKGASDAGIYVGQSRNIIVRRNRAEVNVAGIEIENSRFADVYENVSTNNTGGILVFDLPNLPVKDGGHTRVFHNKIFNNNTPNFAPPGNIVGVVPAGTGFMVMANRDVEIFENEISGHNTGSVGVVSYLISEIPFEDSAYNPIPRRVHIHDNKLENAPDWHVDLKNRFSLVVNALASLEGKRVPDIIYDGIGENYNNAHGLPSEDRICAHHNKTFSGRRTVRFANLQLDKQRWYVPFPGGPLLTDPLPHWCAHARLSPAVLDAPLPLPPSTPEPTPGEIAALCNRTGDGPNWQALGTVDCPQLSQYRLFADRTDPTRNAVGGVPYDLTTPLFSDYATKYRFVFLPPSTKAHYRAEGAFDFPVGTVISKTFAFGSSPERVVETRLLVRRAEGWIGLPYIWRADRADAELALGGGRTDLDFVYGAKPVKTSYAIPSANQCASCHGAGSGGMQPLGPKAELLNRDFKYADAAGNQLTEWTRRTVLEGAPANPSDAPRLPVWNDPKDGTLERRARAYLSVNCAHCHSATGLARNTGLFLGAEVQSPVQLGICKPPVAAGIGAGQFQYDIVPGKSAQSILPYRIGSNHAKIKMPQIGRSIVHEDGLALVKAWIDSLKGDCGRKGH